MKKTLCLSALLLVFTFNMFGQNWVTNFDTAKQEASKNNENIVLVFQGSDWCGPCIKLNKEIWSSSEFKKLSKNYFVMLKADFPRKKAHKLSKEQTAQNANLAELYNKEGYFPLVVVLNSRGKVLGKMGYEKISPKAYFDKLNSFKPLL